jgi:hypothetical protein
MNNGQGMGPAAYAPVQPFYPEPAVPYMATAPFYASPAPFYGGAPVMGNGRY